MDTIFKFRDCACPGTPHAEGDTVSLLPFLGYQAGAEALRIIIETADQLVMLDERLGPVYLREAVTGWNLVDEDGPVEYSHDALMALPYEETALIADHCDGLYSERVMRPLLRRLNGSLPRTRTGKTSATPRSSRTTPKPASPSSRSTSGAGLQPVP